jgi:biopolymer transport protein ExbD
VSVSLPTATNSIDKPDTQDQTVLAIDAQGRLFLNTVPIASYELSDRILDVLETKNDRIVIIKADKEAAYGSVMDAMDELRSSGIEDMALITDPVPDEEGGA